MNEPKAMRKLHTIENWDKLRGGMFNIIVDSWWLVDEDGNPLFYENHPQCNNNRSISLRLANGWAVKKIPVVFVPVRLQDYQ